MIIGYLTQYRRPGPQAKSKQGQYDTDIHKRSAALKIIFCIVLLDKQSSTIMKTALCVKGEHAGLICFIVVFLIYAIKA